MDHFVWNYTGKLLEAVACHCQTSVVQAGVVQAVTGDNFIVEMTCSFNWLCLCLAL